MTSERLTIAIDGPAASGKTTVGRLLASRLGFRFLDTGVMYRGLAWLALGQGIDLSDGPALGRLASSNILLSAIEEPGTTGVEAEPQEWLYTPEVDAAASQVAQWPEVRDAMVEQQQWTAAEGGIVMVGRDVGTRVAPLADLKVFLLASPETRARRRLLQGGSPESLGAIAGMMAQIEERDGRDTHRSHSPLLPAGDSRMLDTEHMDTRQTVDRILSWLGVD